jgi:hypothetical protein
MTTIGQNEGRWDRILRVILGLFLISLALTGVTVWGWIGVIPLATGMTGFCPAYRLFGMSTLRRPKQT